MAFRQKHGITILCASLACAMAPAFAQDAAASKADKTAFTPSVTLGFEERVRNERWNNTDYNSAKADQRNQYRFRTRLSAVANLTPDLDIAVGLCNEARKIQQPDNLTYSNAAFGKTNAPVQFNGREVFFDTLYANYRVTPQLTVKVGRQDITRGEGFIFMDGTPGDGSRTSYSNAADVAYTWGKSKLEFIAIDNPARDRFLPQLNKIDNPAEANLLCEWDEQAVGFYYSGKEWTGATLDAYYVLKAEKNFNLWNPTKNAYQPDRQFSTLGSRLAYDFGHGVVGTGEFAYQWGKQDAGTDPRNAAITVVAKDISAWGGYARVKKSFEASWKPSVSVGYIALSGQDPSDTTKVTAWDPVFSRFPKWSEFFIYSSAPEKGVAYWQNLSMWELEFRCQPCKPLNLRGTYYHMSALQSSTGTDKDRGDLYEVRADLQVTKEWKGHVVYERMLPGNFRTASDSGYFFRTEVSYTFNRRFGL